MAGIHNISQREDQQVFEDDVVMYRLWMIWIVAEEVNKMKEGQEQTAFGMEQPGEPIGMPGVVSIWIEGDYGGDAWENDHRSQVDVEGEQRRTSPPSQRSRFLKDPSSWLAS